MLPWLYWALAGWYVGMAFGMARLHQRRFLHIDDAGFRGRLRVWESRFEYAWSDVTRLEPVGPADGLVHGPAGEPRRLSFKKLHDGPAHRNRLLTQAEAAR